VADLEQGSRNTTISDETLRRMLAENRDVEWDKAYIYLRNRPEVLEGILNPQQWRDLLANDPRLLDTKQILEDGLTLTQGPNRDPAMVLGLHVSKANQRQKDGSYDNYSGRWWMPKSDVTLTTMPVRSGMADPESHIFPVANEFQSGVFLIDDTRVMIPLAEAQRLTKLNEQKIVDEFDPDTVLGVDPARATMVLVRAVEGVTPDALRDEVDRTYQQFVREIMLDDTAIEKPPTFSVGILTWEQQQAQFIGPVEKEREMMRTLFSLVYIVCAGLVLAIFWAIVYEKTRDIGILRSVGASRIGISWIFLRYGLIVGTLGAIFGFGLGSLVVVNINAIHNAMGDPPQWLAYVLGTLTAATLGFTLWKLRTGLLMPPVLGALIFLVLLIMTIGVALLIKIGGAVIWNPEIYYFTIIPNEVDLNSAYFTMIGAVVFSLVGAFLPAAKAADVDPVKALHYE
jgi:lipoprotein-releasing system permease protein